MVEPASQSEPGPPPVPDPFSEPEPERCPPPPIPIGGRCVAAVWEPGTGCTTRPLPDGTPCGIDGLCQASGTCLAGVCNRPPPGKLEWRALRNVRPSESFSSAPVWDPEGNMYVGRTGHGGGGLGLVSYGPNGTQRWGKATDAFALMWLGDRLLVADWGDSRDAYDTTPGRDGIRAFDAAGETLWLTTARELLPDVSGNEPEVRRRWWRGNDIWRLDGDGRPFIELQAGTPCATWRLFIDPATGEVAERTTLPGCSQGDLFRVGDVLVTVTPPDNERMLEVVEGGVTLWRREGPSFTVHGVSSDGVLVDQTHPCADAQSLHLLALRSGAMIRDLQWNTRRALVNRQAGWAFGLPQESATSGACENRYFTRADLLVFDPDTGEERARLTGGGSWAMAMTNRGTVLVALDGDGENDSRGRLVEIDARGETATCETTFTDPRGMSLLDGRLQVSATGLAGGSYIVLYDVPGLGPPVE